MPNMKNKYKHIYTLKYSCFDWSHFKIEFDSTHKWVSQMRFDIELGKYMANVSSFEKQRIFNQEYYIISHVTFNI